MINNTMEPCPHVRQTSGQDRQTFLLKGFSNKEQFYLRKDLRKHIVSISNTLAPMPRLPRLVRRIAEAFISSEQRKFLAGNPVIFSSCGVRPATWKQSESQPCHRVPESIKWVQDFAQFTMIKLNPTEHLWNNMVFLSFLYLLPIPE